MFLFHVNTVLFLKKGTLFKGGGGQYIMKYSIIKSMYKSPAMSYVQPDPEKLSLEAATSLG